MLAAGGIAGKGSIGNAYIDITEEK
jgi:hypothetical protein